MFDLASLWPGRRPRRGRRPPAVRPRLEALEGRLAPAVYNVNSLLDLSIAAGVNNATGVINNTGGVVTLRSAVQAANSTAGSNTINLTLSGTYKITLAGASEDGNQTGDFDILSNPSDQGAGALLIQNTSGGAVLVDGNHLDRVFDINPGGATDAASRLQVTLQGFGVINGAASGGGGVRDQGNGNLTLTNMVVAGNHAAADGGGLSMENAPAAAPWTLTLNNTAVVYNDAGGAGGGLEAAGGGQILMTAGQITGNTCVNGGAGAWLDAVGTTGANLGLTDVLVSGNAAQNGPGGGVGNGGNGTASFVFCTVQNNSSGAAGGGYGDENGLGALFVTDSAFLANSAGGDGGGVQEGGPSLVIVSSAIHSNSAGASGGGVFASGPALTIGGCTIAGNVAGGGGGVEVRTGGPGSVIYDTTVASNRTQDRSGATGGGIDAPAPAFAGGLTLLNDTINANFAPTGGGVFWGGAAGTVSLQNTVVAANAARTGPDADNPAGAFTDGGGNLVGVGGAGGGNTGFTAASSKAGTAAAPLDPQLGALADNGSPPVGAPGTAQPLLTEVPLSTSRLIDRGVAAGAPSTDERGLPRPDGGANESPDIGAVEVQDSPPSVSVAFGPGGEVIELVNAEGVLTQFDSTGAHVLGGGVRSATAAFNNGSLAVLVVTLSGELIQYDSAGAHDLGGGAMSACLAFGPAGEVIDVVDAAGVLRQYDAAGAHLLGAGVSSVSVAFNNGGEVVLVVNTAGELMQYDAAGVHDLGGGVLSAGVAFSGGSETIDLITLADALFQYDPSGAHFLARIS